MVHRPCAVTHIIYRRKKSQSIPASYSVLLLIKPLSCHLSCHFLFSPSAALSPSVSFPNAVSPQPDSCHALACFYCFPCWVSGEDSGSYDQSLMFASIAAMAQAKANQSSWEITLSLPGFPSIDTIAYTNPSFPFCKFFQLLWQSPTPPLLFPKLQQLRPHLSLCLNLILYTPSLSAFYLNLRAGKWLHWFRQGLCLS